MSAFDDIFGNFKAPPREPEFSTVWYPTGHLRWSRVPGFRDALQQKFSRTVTIAGCVERQEEWRDVPEA